MVHLGEVSPKVCEVIIEKFEDILGNNELQDDMLEFNWRKSANRRKFDRELFEKYGYLKDIILNPKYQQAKQFIEENANFDVFLGDSLLPTTTAVIVLFMLHKRVSNTLIGLVALFLFNVNPLYVCLAAVALWVLSAGKQPPKQFNGQNARAAKAHIASNSNVAKEVRIDQNNMASVQTEYDHVLIGNDIGTLYTAALLSKNGHTCCVLKPASLGPSCEVHPTGAPCAAPIVNLSIGRIERYQALLDAAQCSLKADQRVAFAPCGTEQDGFTSSILHTSASATGGGLAGLKGTAAGRSRGTYTHLRAGEHSLPHDLCTVHPLEKSTLIASLQQRLYSALPFLTTFLVSRAVPGEEWGRTPLADGTKLFNSMSGTSTELMVHNLDVENSPEAVAVLLGLSSVGGDEGITAADSSAYLLAGALYNASQGIFYPVGGPAAIETSLRTTIHAAGGVVYAGVDVQDIVLEEIVGSKVIRATGVSIAVGSGAAVNSTHAAHGLPDSPSDFIFQARKSVISGTGVLNTYTKLLPPEAVSTAAKEMLSGLTETRPRVKVVYWVRGTQEELGLSSTDYFEVGPQPHLQRQTVTIAAAEGDGGAEPAQAVEVSGTVIDCAENDQKRDKFAGDFVHIWSPSCKDSSWADRHGSNLHVIVVETELTQPFVDIKEFTFPAVDADAADENYNPADSGFTPPGPRIYFSTNAEDARTDPTHPEYATLPGIQVTLSKSKQDMLQQRADRVLGAVYCNVLRNVECSVVLLPVLSGGASVSCTSKKFSNKLSAVTDVQNLFLTGRDLGTTGLAGDLQGGWVGANAVLGYSLRELLTSRNIISDLANVK